MFYVTNLDFKTSFLLQDTAKAVQSKHRAPFSSFRPRERSLLGLSLSPAAAMPETALKQRPANTTPGGTVGHRGASGAVAGVFGEPETVGAVEG